MVEALRTVAIATSAVGAVISALAFIALLASLRSVSRRLWAVGWVYIGMSVMITGGSLIVLSGLARGGDTAAFAIGLPPVALMAVASFALVRGASRAFRRAGRGEG
jgi:hypothetical protein